MTNEKFGSIQTNLSGLFAAGLQILISYMSIQIGGCQCVGAGLLPHCFELSVGSGYAAPFYFPQIGRRMQHQAAETTSQHNH
jgi:hypothetical protein